MGIELPSGAKYGDSACRFGNVDRARTCVRISGGNLVVFRWGFWEEECPSSFGSLCSVENEWVLKNQNWEREMRITGAKEEEGLCRCRCWCQRLGKIRVHQRSPFRNWTSGGRRGGDTVDLIWICVWAATDTRLYLELSFYFFGFVFYFLGFQLESYRPKLVGPHFRLVMVLFRVLWNIKIKILSFFVWDFGKNMTMFWNAIMFQTCTLN